MVLTVNNKSIFTNIFPSFKHNTCTKKKYINFCKIYRQEK